MQISQTSDHVFGAAEFHQSAAHLVRAVPNFIHHGRKRDVVGTKFLRVHANLILLHEAAKAGYFSHTRKSLQLIAEKPVLQAAEVGKAVAMMMIDDGVSIYPARAGRVRTYRHRHDESGYGVGQRRRMKGCSDCANHHIFGADERT